MSTHSPSSSSVITSINIGQYLVVADSPYGPHFSASVSNQVILDYLRLTRPGHRERLLFFLFCFYPGKKSACDAKSSHPSEADHILARPCIFSSNHGPEAQKRERSRAVHCATALSHMHARKDAICTIRMYVEDPTVIGQHIKAESSITATLAYGAKTWLIKVGCECIGEDIEALFDWLQANQLLEFK